MGTPISTTEDIESATLSIESESNFFIEPLSVIRPPPSFITTLDAIVD